jgi:hypothetical protein
MIRRGWIKPAFVYDNPAIDSFNVTEQGRNAWVTWSELFEVYLRRDVENRMSKS